MSEDRYSKPFANAETFFKSHDKGFWNTHLGKDQRRLLQKFQTKEVRGDGACLFHAVGKLVNQPYQQIIERVKEAIPRLNITGTFAPFKSGAKIYDALSLPNPNPTQNNKRVYMTKELMNRHFKTDTMPISQWYLAILNHLDGVQLVDDAFVSIIAHALDYSIVEYQFKNGLGPAYYHNTNAGNGPMYILLHGTHYYPLRLVSEPPARNDWVGGRKGFVIDSPNLEKAAAPDRSKGGLIPAEVLGRLQKLRKNAPLLKQIRTLNAEGKLPQLRRLRTLADASRSRAEPNAGPPSGPYWEEQKTRCV